MTNYRKGYNLENKTQRLLERFGWDTFRSAGSHTAFDVLAIKDEVILKIQCKKTSSDKLYLYDLVAGKNNLLIYSFNRTPIYVKEISEESMKLNKEDKHLKFENYLRGGTSCINS